MSTQILVIKLSSSTRSRRLRFVAVAVQGNRLKCVEIESRPPTHRAFHVINPIHLWRFTPHTHSVRSFTALYPQRCNFYAEADPSLRVTLRSVRRITGFFRACGRGSVRTPASYATRPHSNESCDVSSSDRLVRGKSTKERPISTVIGSELIVCQVARCLLVATPSMTPVRSISLPCLNVFRIFCFLRVSWWRSFRVRGGTGNGGYGNRI